MDQCSSAQLACGCMVRALALHEISRTIKGPAVLHLVPRKNDVGVIQSLSVCTEHNTLVCIVGQTCHDVDFSDLVMMRTCCVCRLFGSETNHFSTG